MESQARCTSESLMELVKRGKDLEKKIPVVLVNSEVCELQDLMTSCRSHVDVQS